MILPEHFKHHDRMKPYCSSPMLVLGRQDNPKNYNFGVPYFTLDPDGGDFQLDLNTPLEFGTWKTIYNIGTIEHVFDYRQALKNVACMVAPMGYYLHHSPCAGYEGHGIHVTDPLATMAFFTLNGFQLVDHWYTTQRGAITTRPKQKAGNVLLWFVARRKKILPCLNVPQQIFRDGKKGRKR